MKLVFAPHLNRHVVLGACKLPSPHRPKFKLSAYLDHANLPPSPSVCDYSAPAMPVITNVEGNDRVGDCVLAEEAHFIGVMTGNAGALYSYTTAQTLALYSAITGYNPADPNSDQGTDPIVALNYLCKHAYADGTTLAGYAEVDTKNQAEVTFAISTFGNLKLWLGLPGPWINPFPSANGFRWDVAPPDANNGHCIGSDSYNSPLIVGAPTAEGVQVFTWGLVGTMTWPALAALCTEAAGGGAAVRITPDWLRKGLNTTPTGLAWGDLVSDFNQFLGGALPIPPAPVPPPPPPGPPPTAPPGLAQAQAALVTAFRAAHPLMTRDTAEAIATGALPPLWPPS